MIIFWNFLYVGFWVQSFETILYQTQFWCVHPLHFHGVGLSKSQWRQQLSWSWWTGVSPGGEWIPALGHTKQASYRSVKYRTFRMKLFFKWLIQVWKALKEQTFSGYIKMPKSCFKPNGFNLEWAFRFLVPNLHD